MESSRSASGTNKDRDKDESESRCSETLSFCNDEEEETDINYELSVFFEHFHSLLKQFGNDDDFWQFHDNDDDEALDVDGTEKWDLKRFTWALVNIAEEYNGSVSKKVLSNFRRKIGDSIAETATADGLCSYIIKALKEMMNSKSEDLTITATLKNVVTCLGSFTEVSLLLCEKLSSMRRFLETSKQFLAQEGIFNRIKINKVYETDNPGMSFLYDFLAPLLYIASRDELVIALKDVGFTDVLKEFLSNESPDIWMQVLTLLAALVTEEECDIIQSNKERVEELLNVLAEGLEESEIRVGGWSCPRAVAHTFRLLARNDANKRMLVELGAFQVLSKLGKVKRKEETMECLQLIWVLCYDKENKKEVVDNEELGLVDLLLELQESTEKDIACASCNALWTIRDELTKSKNRRFRKIGETYSQSAKDNHTRSQVKYRLKSSDTTKTGENKNTFSNKVDHAIFNAESILRHEKAKKHIMISYDKNHREVLLKLKENISRRGYSKPSMPIH
ncbi:uncharacterized protein LOC128240904 isoform X2 [Mya arenaria]|uniref:uncharacterized protein LOC128240904 isoform X2 n=1 Tax=Mya arenaria TaxID=6604 RepID=UPI0022E1712F|nr:uncharacterized protein LOC128240904 isoform X2 [Mya arenaria]